jgi:multidrug efflux pump subunit AcrB
VKNIESQTLAGVSVIRILFQPNVRIDSAIAQVTAVSQTILRRIPPGAQPPTIIRYNASRFARINLDPAQFREYFAADLSAEQAAFMARSQVL